jgi:hypothetical protein
MIKTPNGLITKIHLIISIVIVILVALIYGFKPDLLFDISITTNDEHSVFKAISGLYLGFSLLWILGIFNSSYLKTALISNVIFMLGLGFGRCFSIVIDGFPGTFFLYGTIGEMILGIYGLWVLKTIYFE